MGPEGAMGSVVTNDSDLLGTQLYSKRTTIYFFRAALLRYNSHTVQLTYLKCSIHWFLVYS